MKKITKILLVFLIAALCVGSFAACGGGSGGMTSDGRYILSVYRGRSSGMIDGKDDALVTEAIEKKFKEDTGIGIDLQMTLETNTSIPQKVDLDYSKKDKQMDLVFHYASEDVGSAIVKYAKESESVKEVEGLLEQYGQHILAAIRQGDTNHIAEKTGYVLQENGELKMTMIPGVYAEKQYGILLNKTYMKQVQDKTGLDPETFDIANENYQNMNFKQFDTLLRAMKSIPDVQYSLTGYPWDISQTVSTAISPPCSNGRRTACGRPTATTRAKCRCVRIS